MKLKKTEKAHAELRPGTRTLGQRERTLLLLADGQNTATYVSSLFDGEGENLVRQLLREGYLSEIEPEIFALDAEPEPIKVSADQFQGKRSLATTRMFLFDICERMFSRKNTGLAISFRDALRNARDRESMLAVSREMMAEIEKIAGYERADSISARIAMLLPPED